jgi:hypothetical protein
MSNDFQVLVLDNVTNKNISMYADDAAFAVQHYGTRYSYVAVPSTSSSNKLTVYESIAAIQAASISASNNIIMCLSYATPGDLQGFPIIFVGQAASSSLPGTIQSADGRYWVINNDVVTPQMFGAVGDGVILTTITLAAASANLACSTAAFTQKDVGKVICVFRAQATPFYSLVTTILSVTDATDVVLAANAGHTVTSIAGITAVYGTDDTPAINSAIAFITARMSGHVYFPAAIYLVNGAFQAGSQAQIPILASANSDFTLRLSGSVSSHYPIDGMNLSGSIIFSTIVSSAGANSGFNSVLGSQSTRYMRLEMDRLTFYTVEDAQHSCLNLRGLSQASLDYIMVGPGIEMSLGYQGVVSAFTSSYGIIMPVNNNHVASWLLRSTISGFNTGLSVCDHFWGDALGIYYCSNGLEFQNSDHGVHIGSLSMEFNYNHINFVGSTFAVVLIDFFDFEPATLTEIVDAGNIGRGTIRWGYNFANGSFTGIRVTGGSKLIIARIDQDISLLSMTYANLPVYPVLGQRVVISDSTVNTWGTAVAVGSGADVVTAQWNGSAWTVIGI